DWVDVVISTVPPQANFELPSSLIREDLILVELVYRPRKTYFIQQGEANGCQCIEGIEILLEQGLIQFELWMHSPSPRKKVIEQFIQLDPQLFNDVPSSFKK